MDTCGSTFFPCLPPHLLFSTLNFFFLSHPFPSPGLNGESNLEQPPPFIQSHVEWMNPHYHGKGPSFFFFLPRDFHTDSLTFPARMNVRKSGKLEKRNVDETPLPCEYSGVGAVVCFFPLLHGNISVFKGKEHSLVYILSYYIEQYMSQESKKTIKKSFFFSEKKKSKFKTLRRYNKLKCRYTAQLSSEVSESEPAVKSTFFSIVTHFTLSWSGSFF